MKKIILSISLQLFVLFSFAQSSTLPVKELKTANDSLLILYITGDGGMNTFSKNLSSGFQSAGYSVTSIDAKSYFWKKKTPDQAASDIDAYLQAQTGKRKSAQLVLIGYSFGADVMPFIVNKLPAAVQQRIKSVILLSPGATTDFEIHWSDMLGMDKKRSMDVVAEVAKLRANTVILAGSDEKSVYQSKAKTNYHLEILPGGHHYDDNTDELVKVMMKYFH